MSERELVELVKRLLTYVSFHRVRGVDRVGFHLVENASGFDVSHYVCSDLQYIFSQMKELVDKEQEL